MLARTRERRDALGARDRRGAPAGAAAAGGDVALATTADGLVEGPTADLGADRDGARSALAVRRRAPPRWPQLCRRGACISSPTARSRARSTPRWSCIQCTKPRANVGNHRVRRPSRRSTAGPRTKPISRSPTSVRAQQVRVTRDARRQRHLSIARSTWRPGEALQQVAARRARRRTGTARPRSPRATTRSAPTTRRSAGSQDAKPLPWRWSAGRRHGSHDRSDRPAASPRSSSRRARTAPGAKISSSSIAGCRREPPGNARAVHRAAAVGVARDRRAIDSSSSRNGWPPAPVPCSMASIRSPSPSIAPGSTARLWGGRWRGRRAARTRVRERAAGASARGRARIRSARFEPRVRARVPRVDGERDRLARSPARHSGAADGARGARRTVTRVTGPRGAVPLMKLPGEASAALAAPRDLYRGSAAARARPLRSTSPMPPSRTWSGRPPTRRRRWWRCRRRVRDVRGGSISSSSASRGVFVEWWTWLRRITV